MIHQELRHATPSARTESLRRRAQELIPGGAHTYSKADDQFPLDAPAFIERGDGAYVWTPTTVGLSTGEWAFAQSSSGTRIRGCSKP